VWSPLFVTGANINQSAVSLCTVVTGSCPDFLLNIMKRSSPAFSRRKERERIKLLTIGNQVELL
jgi:hypothetical protein